MKILYGTCNFATIRTEGSLYVDKTPFLPLLENLSGRYQLFLRPRRFGKSTLLSMLEHYYDINHADRFDELFRGLWVHQNPTPEKNKYLVLSLDFSPVRSDGTVAEIRTSFARTIKVALRSFINRYKTVVPDLTMASSIVGSDDDDAGALVADVLQIVAAAGHSVYLLIDEYDHFGNRLLSDGEESTYRTLVGTNGYIRNFYGSLKALTRTSLVRMFVTGVSPIMLDDLSSGFNIIAHISQLCEFNALAGFTRVDVERAVDDLLRAKPQLATDERLGNRDQLMGALERYYNGYRFSPVASERLYNSTLVIYFLAAVSSTGGYPRQMLDLNVRTDYGRLHAIARAATERDTEMRELLEEILTNESVQSPLVEQFGTRISLDRARLVSLFYYMGMLTFSENAVETVEPQLVVPNRVMRELQWSYLALALEDHDHIKIDMTYVENALTKMSVTGDIQPFVKIFHDQVVKRIGLRELLKFDEQTMKLMLFAYVAQTQAFYLMTEKEFNQGYCDLLLGLRGIGTAAKHAWIIEAKYVKTDATENEIEAAIQQGFAQIEKYTADKDLVAMLTRGHFLKAGVLMFVGVKDVFFRAWPKT
ncbi:MAG: AAA family ATPase [Polyangiaceae bacterium]|nr:AAA family ATPase [Polyangiaceae bacterium]